MKLLTKIRRDQYSMSCLSKIFTPYEINVLKQSNYLLYYEFKNGWHLYDDDETPIYHNDLLETGFNLLPDEITKHYLIAPHRIDIKRMIREHTHEMTIHASIEDDINDRIYTFYADICDVL